MADNGQQPAGDAWGDVISDERKAELEERLQAWEQETDHGERKGPFDSRGPSKKERAALRLSGADVFWLAARTVAGTGEAWAIAVQMERLRRAQVDRPLYLLLRLDGLHLEGAMVRDAHLEHAMLSGAHLEHAMLARANLEKAALFGTHLERAVLQRASLKSATLRGAHLEGSSLRLAHLEGADLSRAYLDNAVDLSGAKLCALS